MTISSCAHIPKWSPRPVGTWGRGPARPLLPSKEAREVRPSHGLHCWFLGQGQYELESRTHMAPSLLCNQRILSAVPGKAPCQGYSFTNHQSGNSRSQRPGSRGTDRERLQPAVQTDPPAKAEIFTPEVGTCFLAWPQPAHPNCLSWQPHMVGDTGTCHIWACACTQLSPLNLSCLSPDHRPGWPPDSAMKLRKRNTHV